MSDHDTSQEPVTLTIAEWTAPDGLRYETQTNPPLDILRAVNRGLDAYNRAQIGDYTYERLAVFSYDTPEQRTLIGGVFGDLLWDWLHIDTLWTHEDYRGHGVGSTLMHAIEEAARERGVVNVHLATTSFQALPFYLKLGYEVFGELPNKPLGSTWYYLRKLGKPPTPLSK